MRWSANIGRPTLLSRWLVERVLVPCIMAMLTVAGLPVGVATSEATWERPRSERLIVLPPSSVEELWAVAGALEHEGFHTVHLLPPRCLIGRGEVAPQAGWQVFSPGESPFRAQDPVTDAGVTRWVLRAWEMRGADRTVDIPHVTSARRGLHEGMRSFLPPDFPTDRTSSLSSRLPQPLAYHPGEYNTSAVLAGRLAIGILVPESDGTLDPDLETWTDEDLAHAVNKVLTAVDFYAVNFPDTALQAVYEWRVVATPYEPVTRRAGYGNAEMTWIEPLLRSIGITTPSFNGVRAYVNDLRARSGTDWAFAVFLAGSRHDDDGCFPDGRLFAFAYRGGPYLVTTDTVGGWGTEGLDWVIAHEMGHIFYATDEYSGACACDEMGGRHFDIPNDNCEGCPDAGTPCIMRSGSGYADAAVCDATRRMWGWHLRPTVGIDAQVTHTPGTFRLDVLWSMEHYGLRHEAEVGLVLELGGRFYSFPSWSEGVSLLPITVPPVLTLTGVPVLEVIVPDDLALSGTWYTGVLDPVRGEVVSMASSPFSWDAVR